MSTGRKSWSLQQRDYGAAQKTGRHASFGGTWDGATAESSVLFSLARLPPPKQRTGPSLRGLAKTKNFYTLMEAMVLCMK